MKTLSAVLLAGFLTLALSASVFADFGGGPRGGFGPGGGPGFAGPELMLEHMADHLDLDDTQRESVRNIMEAAKPELEAFRDQLRSNREALMALETSDPAYSTAVNNIAVANGQLATEGTLLATRIRSEINAVLTDEQREKLARGKERMRNAAERRLQRR